MRIQPKIFAAILSITVPVLIVSGAITYFFAEQQITDHIKEELEVVATMEKSLVVESIERNFERLDGITSRTQLRLSLENYSESKNIQDVHKINKILDDAKLSIPDIIDLHVLSHKGKVLFSTDDDHMGKDFLNSPSFRDAHHENTINVSMREKDESVLYISGPLRLDSNFLGVMVMETNINLLMRSTGDQILFGNSGEVILAVRNENGDAQVITPLLFADYTKTIIPKQNLKDPIIHSLTHNQTTFPDSVNYYGKESLSATRHVEETGWGLTVIFDKQEAFLPLLKIQITIVLSVIFVIMISILVSLFISNSISKPILRLQASTKEMAKGKLKGKIEISGSDEITDLAVDINKMRGSLNQAQKDMVKNERLSAVGELSSRLAHDIRNPISVINTAVSLLKQTKLGLIEKDMQKLDMIYNANYKIKYLVENVLDFVRTREPQYEETSLLEILQFAVKSIREAKNIQFVLPTNDIKIMCDPNQIEVVFENILTNSIQSIEGKQGTATITFHEEDEHALINFQDSGPGIPENNISKIFDPLFTTKKEGTGLGLASCKSIIESHNGTLTVSNNPTAFRIKIPKQSKGSKI